MMLYALYALAGAILIIDFVVCGFLIFCVICCKKGTRQIEDHDAESKKKLLFREVENDH